MEWYWILLLVLAGLVFFWLFSSYFAAFWVYHFTLRRRKGTWGRVCSSKDPRQLKMDAIGMAWQADKEAYRRDVHITRDGANLYGEYYDFGSDKAVMVLSGRTESLRYGYFFAIPYAKAGLNVLVVDPRAHGLSDGKFNTVGFEESLDACEWARLLQDEFGIRSLVFHGICIGSAGGMLAAVNEHCPECVCGMVTEGMFPYFGCSMKNHLKERHCDFFPVLQAIDFWMRVFTGHSMMRGPIDVIDRMNKPLLMLQSREDRYSTPDNAGLLFEKCGSEKKKIVYFPHGDHSMLRITDMERYDAEITAFLKELF